MELKDRYKALFEIFESENENFSDMINRVVFSDSIKYFDRYMEILPDLSKDYLRSCWQFYHADRDDKKQDYTNDSLSMLCSAMVVPANGQQVTVFDCCSGSGSLTIGAWNINHNIHSVCVELDETVIPLLLFNLCVRNIPAHVSYGNALTGIVTDTWIIEKGNKYGVCHKSLFPETYSERIDVAVCNPPFNLSENSRLLNYKFIRECLKKASSASVILPRGVLTSDREKEERKFLIDEKLLQSVILLPQGFFESTSVGICLIVASNTKKEGVYLLDADSLTSTETRLQRGEGDNTARLYKKQMAVIDKVQLAAIYELSHKESDVSVYVPYQDINDNYSFLYGQYKPLPSVDEEHSLHRDYDDIISDINKLVRMKNTLKVTANKVWAEQLGIDISESTEADKKLTKDINEALKSMGIESRVETSDYFSLSNSKILEIRQTDKEILSPVIESFLPLWIQHIRTFNVLENQLFAELRDSLLVPLMAGRISISEETNK